MKRERDSRALREDVRDRVGPPPLFGRLDPRHLRRPYHVAPAVHPGLRLDRDGLAPTSQGAAHSSQLPRFPSQHLKHALTTAGVCSSAVMNILHRI